MNKPAPAPAVVPGPTSDFTKFLSAPASTRPLAFFRIGVAAVLLVQAFTLLSSVLPLYGNHGVVQWSVGAALVRPDVPHIAWLAQWLAPWGVSDVAAVQGVFLVYMTALAALLVGWQTRLAALLSCLTHTMLNQSGNASIYGVDMFAQIALFYCVLMPVGRTLSADAGVQPEKPTAFARLCLRVLQIHLCIIYFTSGLDKAEGIQWWNGEAVWRGLMRPDMAMFDFTWLAFVPWMAMLICWGTLLLEIGYAIFIWPKRTRKLWAWLTISMHVGIAVAMGLWSFSALMIVLTASVFLFSAEPKQEMMKA